MSSTRDHRRDHRTVAVLGVLAALAALLLAGCGGDPQPRASDHASGHASQHGASHDEMAGMDMGGSGGPSAPASMICSDEIRQAVQRTFALDAEPAATPHWSRADRTYSCSYRLPGGRLELSVQDALVGAQGRAHFARLRQDLPGARPIRGLRNLGFPAVSSPRGDVAFLKDGKTLLVDATALAPARLPRDYTRPDVAYAVASAVVACWTE